MIEKGRERKLALLLFEKIKIKTTNQPTNQNQQKQTRSQTGFNMG